MDSLGRHEQLLRVFHLIDILSAARVALSALELKERLKDRGVIDDMSDRNIRRDVGFLVTFGYDVREESQRNGRGTARKAWRIVPKKGAGGLDGPVVSLPELLSLAAAREFLTPLAGTFYWRGISQLIARVERIATPELLDYAEKHREGLLVHPRPAGAKYTTRTLNAVNRAIRNSLELAIRYRALADERPRTVIIRPEAMVVYDGSVYVAAYKAPASPSTKASARSSEESDEAIRFYKLDRFVDARATSRPFTPRPETVESLLADSMTMFRSPRPPRRFRIKVAAVRSRWVAEKPFHPRQRVVPQDDGGVILEIDRAWDEEMVPQLLGLADAAEVLEPADVRDRMLDTARRIAAQYERAPTSHHRRAKPS